MPAITVNLDEEMSTLVDELKQHIGASSKADVFRQALALLDLAVEAEEGDGSLAIVDDKDKVQLIQVLRARRRKRRNSDTKRRPENDPPTADTVSEA